MSKIFVSCGCSFGEIGFTARVIDKHKLTRYIFDREQTTIVRELTLGFWPDTVSLLLRNHRLSFKLPKDVREDKVFSCRGICLTTCAYDSDTICPILKNNDVQHRMPAF